MVFLVVLITFEPILDGFFEILEKSRNPRWRTKMSSIKNGYAIIKSCDVITSDVRGDIFRCTFYPPRLIVITFILSEGRREGIRPSRPVVKDQTKSGLNRVNM